MDTNIQAAMSLAQSTPLQSPVRVGAGQQPYSNTKADKASKDFESMFISQFLGSIYQGISTDGPTGGGQGEMMFRSLLINQYAESIEKQGGFGLAAAVKAELLKHQQVAQPESAP